MIAVIVEGHGDAQAVPLLMRRMLAEFGLYPKIAARRLKRQQVVKIGELEKALDFAAMDGDCEAVLVVLDADDDCPARVGPELAERARVRVGHLRTGVVLANREFEAWLVASIETLRGRHGIRAEAGPPDDPDAIRSPKGWIERCMEGHGYSETVDQAGLAGAMDLDLVRRRSRSFRKFEREVLRVAGDPSLSRDG